MRTIVSYTGGVAVRVVFADHVADDARRLLVGLVPVVRKLVHREEHAAVNGLQSIARIRERRPTITLMA
jgi:flagellar biosynthesis/type III secretory pathway ATPase